MLTGQNVQILGAGIAGLAAAIAIAARGAHVSVAEQADEITEVGAGLQISPNGVAVMDALGLGAKLREIATRATAVNLLDYRHDRRVLRMDLAAHARDQDYLFVHRADLIDLLAAGARAVGVEIALGRRAVAVQDGENAAQITWQDGTLSSSNLLVAADGLSSCARAGVTGVQEPFFTGQVAWRALVPGDGTSPDEVTVHMGPGRHLVQYPLRQGRLMNIVAVQEQGEWTQEGWQQPGDPDTLRAVFSDFSDAVQNRLAQVDDVNVWGLFRHAIAQKWSSRHVILTGDAVHPTLPFLAQGATMGLEDAWVLADCLAAHDMPLAGAAYQTRRHDRVARVIAAANANARNYHLRHPVGRMAAHTLLRVAGTLAPKQVVGRFDWLYRHDVTAS